ncbi:MAG: DUF423 domain-containing protein [Methylocystaceae bacterium]|nr:MAG: DUF423 domain-containing protein [Methylocystaceae bacterium]
MPRWVLIVVSVAALQGGGGVLLSAAAAHIESSANLTTASQFLMIHAAAALAFAAIAASGVYQRWLGGAVAALQAGVTLFAGDLALRAMTGAKLFPYAAPLGGSLVILGWTAAAAWALAAALQFRR